MMKTRLLAVILTFLIYDVHCDQMPAAVRNARKHKLGLYGSNDDVVILTDKNFYKQLIYKENIWVIEFYNSWCGHCIKFAPTWKTFGNYARGWDAVLSVGAIDCASPNTTNVCRSFEKRGFPTIMYFKPRVSFQSVNRTDAKGDQVLVGGQKINKLLTVSHDFIDKYAEVMKRWPKLSPLSKIEDIWSEAKDSHEYVFLIFEDEKSLLGKEVILDTMKYKQILVRRMLKMDVEKFGINTFPSLYSINKDGIYKKIISGNPQKGNRAKFGEAILVSSGLLVKTNRTSSKSESEVKNKGEGEPEKAGDSPPESKMEEEKGYTKTPVAVHMTDLESALHYSLMQEIAIKSTIKDEALAALKAFITVLLRYFPGRAQSLTYLMRVNEWLNTVSSSLTGETWANKLSDLQDSEAYLPSDQQWIGCEGSEPRYRGYPCGMWTLFHTLTVAAYLSPKRSNPHEVLLAVRGYMKNFFGCDECSENFYKMASSLEDEIHKKEEAVLWLWRAHNKANKRLHGDLSEDPDHPKIQFPSAASCPACRSSDGVSWDESEVLKYIVSLYRHENIVHEELQEKVEKKSDEELDWWEKKQKAEDLAKIQELKRKKTDPTIKEINQWNQEDDGPKRWERDEDGEADEPRRQENDSDNQGFKYDELRRKERGDIDNNVGMRNRQVFPMKRGWGLNGIDLGMCMMFYVMCAVIILLMYYHFTVRRNWKPCACLPL